VLVGLLNFVFTTHAKLHVGSTAPEFTLPDENGVKHSLSEFLHQGKNVALLFYPKDESPHCTKQMCNVRNNYDQLAEYNITVIGISYDTAGSHKAFKKKHSLPFLLLTDADKKVARAYNATGKWYTLGLIPKRITYLINQHGKIVAIIKHVNVKDHAQQIVDACK
jgi:peroxiredoxin Q/BCP